MQDNWYEASVSAHHPHTIISVVDWASDASERHFRPVEKKPSKKPSEDPIAEHASYNVFAWGVNDPECGKRSIEKEYIDKLASPIGWHAIPAANDPKSRGVRYQDPYKIVNFTTTWGNNVSTYLRFS